MPRFTVPRLAIGNDVIDGWIEALCAAVERANNPTASPPVTLQAMPEGLHFGGTRGLFAHAKSGAGGVPAMSGTTPGHADVTLYSDDGSALVSQTVTEKAWNKSAAAVGANKHLILVRIEPRWWVLWEDCG